MARCIKFIETYCKVPTGPLTGQPMKLRPFQRRIIEELLADGVRGGAMSIPRKNAKSTLCAAIGLWAVADDPEGPQVTLVSSNSLQVQRTLFTPARQMCAMHEALDGDRDRDGWLRVYKSTGRAHIESAWNEGYLWPLPADHDRLQGLNPTIALVDEAQLVPTDVFAALTDAEGARRESLILAIGTPHQDRLNCTLWEERKLALAGAPMAWIEYAAADDADWRDPKAWRYANPALAAGMLAEDVFIKRVASIELVDEPRRKREAILRWRMYRLGQWPADDDMGDPFARAWSRCEDPDARADGQLYFAADVGLDGDTPAVIVAVGNSQLSVVEQRFGTEWLPDRLAELVSDHGGMVVIDANGPIGAREHELEQLVPLQRFTRPMVYKACMRFAEDVEAGYVRVEPSDELRRAVSGARRSGAADMWRWTRRRSEVDIAPLMAATLAWYASISIPVPSIN